MHHEQVIERFEHAGLTIVICADPDASSPREYDNLCHMVTWHRRYNLGDEQTREPMSAKDVVRRVRDKGDRVLAILPIYAYEHGEITLRCGAFGDRWDSGQVGWAYVTRSRATEMGCVGPYGGPEGGTWDKERLSEAIRSEVDLYDRWGRGLFVGFCVEDSDGENLDSCWGFDDVDYCKTEAKSAAEHVAATARAPGVSGVSCESKASP